MEKKNWFNQTISEAEKALETNLKTGLTSEQVKERQERYGLNELKEQIDGVWYKRDSTDYPFFAYWQKSLQIISDGEGVE